MMSFARHLHGEPQKAQIRLSLEWQMGITNDNYLYIFNKYYLCAPLLTSFYRFCMRIRLYLRAPLGQAEVQGLEECFAWQIALLPLVANSGELQPLWRPLFTCQMTCHHAGECNFMPLNCFTV